MSATLGFTVLESRLSFLVLLAIALLPTRLCMVSHFLCKVGFALDEELKKSAACDYVKTALAAEISREALGLKQIDLMISGNQPVKAIGHICDLSLFSVIFNLLPQVPD
ncbi:hypothetical protein V6N13_067122 [Hibiscus sabdariffa]|uniref:Uncharacterized protein n=1 Tax=Hibiscus sabdariffa TaxID=183260 RepID=A0ABR2DSG6_9ROSI